MNTTNRTHGARRLAKLLGLTQIVFGALIVLTAIWLVISFPLWWGDDAPRLPLPVEVAIQAEEEFLSLESAEAPFSSWSFERMSGDLKVVFVNPWAHTLFLFFGILEMLIAASALRGVEFTGGELSAPWFTDFGGGGFFTGWIILIISEAFRQGADLKREQSLTI